jgi:hypothetical protein
MALTTAAALKQWFETFGLTGTPIFNRAPSRPQKRPYITITDATPLVPGRLEDGGPGTGVETVLIDVWQDWKSHNNAGALVEDETLPSFLVKKLHGGRPVDASGHPILATGVGGTGIIYRVIVESVHRFLDQTVEDLVHNSLTVNVWRQL